MPIRLSLLPILVSISVLLIYQTPSSHPSIRDREIRFFVSCGDSVFTKMDEEGRGGLSSLLAYVEREKINLELKNGKGYLFFPFVTAKFKKEYPFDGIEPKKDRILEHGAVKLGVGGIQNLLGETDLDDYDAWILFLSENEEGYLTQIPKSTEGAPIFVFGENNSRSSFIYLQNLYQVECPKEFGKLGVLSLYFRNRNLIRQNYEITSINLTDRNRSWKPKSDKFSEESLPKPTLPSKQKDNASEWGKSDNPYASPYNSYDREILGTAKGFGTTP